ncbi:IclR family transcriptional regulator [Tardiphaga sp. 619_E2_N8_5]|uniref:IclR family transcriptional regulator n=1 Tax=unclassified Tardiphaga TaxID=2631404 RepID=UPI003F1E788A
MIEADGPNAQRRPEMVTALARGIDILRCFDSQHPELGTTEIAQKTGIPQPTVWRLCSTLIELGCLVPVTSTGRLRVAFGVMGLGVTALPKVDFASLIDAEMQRIADKAHAGLSLYVAENTDMMTVRRAQGSATLLFNLNIGSRVPMGVSAAGWAYLAVLSDRQRNATLTKLAKRYGDKWPDIWTDAQQAIREFKKQSYLVTRGFLHPDVNAVAVAAVGPNAGQIFTVSCGGPHLSDDDIHNWLGAELVRLADNVRIALQSGDSKFS